MTDYTTFLQQKRDYGSDAGFEPLWLPDFLFDFQEYLVDWAIRKGRAAIFADCGMGKTPMQLVWAQNVVQKTSRPVLTPSPEPYLGPHYAVYPRSLIAPLLLATAPPRVCPACGAPWAPVVERTNPSNWDEPKAFYGAIGGGMDRGRKQQVGAGWSRDLDPPENQTLGHRPTCDCPAHDPVPGWVLDPFLGSGTTLEVCRELGVNCVGLDISPGYLDEHAKPRIGLTPTGALETLPLFEMVEG